jgi:diacylglycerol kinase family enzyme
MTPMPAQPPKALRVAALVNAAAGTVARLGTIKAEEELLSAFNAAGMAATITFVPGEELHATALRAVEQVRAGDLDAIVAGGGDGSIRSVASALADTGVPLGVMPLGTLNHFARDLGIPFDVGGAVAVIAGGAVRNVDVGTMNGEVFLNNSSIGLYPFLVLERERQRRRQHLSKWTAMLLAAVRVLRHLPLFRLTVRVDRLTEACRSPLVFIGNNEYQLTLPAFGRRERLDGAELSVYLAKAQSRLVLFLLAARTILGMSHPARDMRIVKGATATIQSRRHHLLVAFDGEVELLRPPLHYKIRPQALRVFAPMPTDA